MTDLSPRKEELDPIEIASLDEIRALQLDRLKWSLRHAYDNVPMYREKFDAAGVHPDDLKDLSNLAKFPFTLKSDLRDNYPFGLFAVPRDHITRIHASSGTTGPVGAARTGGSATSSCFTYYFMINLLSRPCGYYFTAKFY